MIAAFHPQLPNAFQSTPALRDRSGLARTLRDAFRHKDETLVRFIFENLEALLLSRDQQLHDWAVEFLEALQDSAGWGLPEADAYLAFMGPGARRIWSALDAIRFDLADSSVLEAEVGMWRVVHRGAGPAH
jgi:hypothetical protein